MSIHLRHRPHRGFTLVELLVVYYDGSSGFITQNDLREFGQKGGLAHPFWKANF